MERSGFSSDEHLPIAGSALVRCAGGAELGLGCVMRMLALARALRDCESIRVSFAVTGTDAALNPIRRAGFDGRKIGSTGEFAALVTERKPDLLILDSQYGPSQAKADALRRESRLMAAIDNYSEARLACDFAYYPPLPQARALGWAGARTVPRIGWNYALLGLEPQLAPARVPGSRPTLLVAMEGGDAAGLTLRAARLLAPLDSVFRIRFVVGKFIRDAPKVAASIVAMKNTYETVEGADDLSTEYASADLALCAFGATAYELAAFGVPALYLGLSDDEARSASAFADAGMGALLGVADRVTDAEVAGAVKALMNDPARRRDMRNCGFAAIDGGGAARIAADLAQALREEKAPVRAAI
jgi:spore coat polysaccharide biosynthesis protein SpsF